MDNISSHALQTLRIRLRTARGYRAQLRDMSAGEKRNMDSVPVYRLNETYYGFFGSDNVYTLVEMSVFLVACLESEVRDAERGAGWSASP